MTKSELQFYEPKRRRSRPWANILRIFQWKSSVAGSSEGQERSRLSFRRTTLTSSSVNVKNQSKESITSESQTVAGKREEVTTAALEPINPEESRGFDVEISKKTAIKQTDVPKTLSSSSIPIHHLAELRAAVRRRRSTDECEDEDLGLPPSPLGTSISPSEILTSNLAGRGNITQSTGSDASLLSMDTCDNEEELSLSLVSGSSAVGSFQQEMRIQTPKEGLSDASDGDWPLSHSAARHKISVKPRRTHALPRHRRLQQITSNSGGLPATPEVNEDHWGAVGPDKSGSQEKQIQSKAEKKSAHDRALETPVDQPQPLDQLQQQQQQSRSSPISGSDSTPLLSENSSASSTKLARSKSSVDKKMHYEVANFWKRTREKQIGTSSSEMSPSPAGTPVSKKKESSQKKLDKEDKKKLKEKKDILDSSCDSTDSTTQQPFLSRIFGSMRSSNRRKKDHHKVHPQPEWILQKSEGSEANVKIPSGEIKVPAQQYKGFETIEIAAETILTSKSETERENDAAKPNLPLFSAPQHQKRVSSFRKTEFSNDPVPEDSLRTIHRNEESRGRLTEGSPLVSKHRIHIAGLSPYQEIMSQ